MSIIVAFIELSNKLQEYPTIFFLFKIISLLSVSYRIFFQINKIILFFKAHKVFLTDPVYITYDSWKGLFKDYLILHFKISSFSTLVIWFFDNPCKLAHLTTLFFLLLSSFLLLVFFLISKKKLNFFQGFKLFLFFLFFLSFLSISFLYNLNICLYIWYGIWLDTVVQRAYRIHDVDMANMSFISKVHLVYTMFLFDVEVCKEFPDAYNFRSFKDKKK